MEWVQPRNFVRLRIDDFCQSRDRPRAVKQFISTFNSIVAAFPFLSCCCFSPPESPPTNNVTRASWLCAVEYYYYLLPQQQHTFLQSQCRLITVVGGRSVPLAHHFASNASKQH